MKKFFKIFFVLILPLVTLICGVYLGARISRGNPFVDITIVNRTGENVKVEIVDDEWTTVVDGIGPGKEKRVLVVAKGETSLKPRAIFHDKNVFEGQEIYCEPGYSLLLTVTNNEVKIDHVGLGLY